MAKRSRTYLELAKGPYHVTKVTGPELADKIWFRHFRPMELFLAREFIRKAIIEGMYYFDILLFTEQALEWIRKKPEAIWKIAVPYAHRIDSACWTDEAVYLIEYKVRLKYSAVGQLSVYRDWFKRQYMPDRPVKLVVVFAHDRPELHETCKRLDIQLIKLR